MKKYTLYAPIVKNELPMFKQISDPKNITLDFINTVTSPKDLFFKQTETLFTFKLGKEKDIKPVEPSEKFVVLGIRPCDAKSLSVIDDIYEKDYVDVYYLKRRQNSILIGIACNEPDLNCFCTSVDGSPAGTENLDISLTDLGDKYFIEILTEKGQNLINESQSLFEDASADDEKKKIQLQKDALEKFVRGVDTEGLVQKLDKLFDNDIWEQLSMRCLGCSICTYNCPGCYCFDIQDEVEGLEGCRIRVWDTCQSPEYTLHASGHNPRSARTERMRNKILHKFLYLPKNVNMFGCFGCGRCIELCPENCDILDALHKLKEVPVNE
ncbi:MAG: 4Fe-4S dicluster domain-containing protein [Candidatus Helarchaeota archaeon]|nr:4Fe-4S dicluster domain-containing protein [Candidatus Helarchaeota archaeon]